MYPKIIHSTADDEELLIPSAKELRARNNYETLQKPPKCCCGILNTRCGAFFIGALQISSGLLHLFCCMTYMAVDEETNNQDSAEMVELENIENNKMYWSAFLSMFSIVSGLFVFKGLTSSNERFLKPGIIFYVSAAIGSILHLTYILFYWDEFAIYLRDFLKYYTTNIEETLQSEIDMEKLADMDSTLEVQQLETWQQIEFMINDNITWETQTKGYLMSTISAFIMVNVSIFSWFGWILTNQFAWIRRKNDVEEQV